MCWRLQRASLVALLLRQPQAGRQAPPQVIACNSTSQLTPLQGYLYK